MSCECAKCREHYKTLGFMFGTPSDSEMEDAYRELVKQWHPDLYENYASLRADAEEHFKQIQVAYRGLKEHNSGAAAEPAAVTVTRQPEIRQEPRQEEKPALDFGNAPGVLGARQFTHEIEEMVAPHLGKLGLALAIVDLGGNRARPNYSQFLLLASRGLMMRDARHNISVLWYADLGEINLVDRGKGGKQSAWQKFVGGGGQGGNELQINRNNGMSFCVISNQAEESVKAGIYEHLMRQKAEAQP